MFNVLVFVKS